MKIQKPIFLKNRISGVMLILVSLVLIVIALKSVSGALSQWSASLTAGQQLETVIQFICGALSILVLIGIWTRLPFVVYIQYAWGLSLVLTAVISSMVWGPPMLLPAIAFGLLSIGIAYVLIRITRKYGIHNE